MTYKQITIYKTGGPNVLQFESHEFVPVKANEVLIRIYFAGVSFADILMREGVYADMPRLPFVPGYDIVGIVEKVGAAVTLVHEGDLVAALTKTGGYSQYISLDENELVIIPSGVDLAAASALILNYVTAWQMLHRHCNISAGQAVLIHAAGGGVGTALLQLGELQGLKMFGTVSESKASIVEQYEAIAIDYRKQDFVQTIEKLSPGGVDFVFDGVGHTAWRSYKSLTRNGTLVLYGLTSILQHGRRTPSGIIKTISGYSLLLKSLIPLGRTVNLYQITAYKKNHPQWFHEDLAALFHLLQEKQISPLIHEILPLKEAAHAHERMGSGRVRGKIILDCSKV